MISTVHMSPALSTMVPPLKAPHLKTPLRITSEKDGDPLINGKDLSINQKK